MVTIIVSVSPRVAPLSRHVWPIIDEKPFMSSPQEGEFALEAALWGALELELSSSSRAQIRFLSIMDSG